MQGSYWVLSQPVREGVTIWHRNFYIFQLVGWQNWYVLIVLNDITAWVYFQSIFHIQTKKHVLNLMFIPVSRSNKELITSIWRSEIHERCSSTAVSLIAVWFKAWLTECIEYEIPDEITYSCSNLIQSIFVNVASGCQNLIYFLLNSIVVSF